MSIPSIELHLFYQGVIINSIIAVIAYYGKTVSKSGIIGGLLVGIPIYTFLNWHGFLILFSMFAIGTIATQWGYSIKNQFGIAEKNLGRRGISNVFGKCLAGLLFAVLFHYYRENMFYSIFWKIAFIGSFAAGAFDTVSSELGQLYGKKTFTILPPKKVERGTEGAVSMEGTFAGIIAAIGVIFIFILTGLIPNLTIRDKWIIGGVLLLSAIGSNFIESVIGSLFESKKIINKFTTNFINTFFGGLFAAYLLLWITYIFNID